MTAIVTPGMAEWRGMNDKQPVWSGTGPSLRSLKIELGSPWTPNIPSPSIFGPVRGGGGSGVAHVRVVGSIAPPNPLAVFGSFYQFLSLSNTYRSLRTPADGYVAFGKPLFSDP